jgi:hypothetical protein
MNLLLRTGYLTGLVLLHLVVAHLLSLANLFLDLFFPFASIGAHATSITILGLAIARGHPERSLPLIGIAYHTVSIVPAACLGPKLLLRSLVHHLPLLHLILLAFVAPVLQPQAFGALVYFGHMLGPVAC